MKTLHCFRALLLGLLAIVLTARAQEYQRRAGDVEQLGHVNFPASCSAAVQDDFNRAVAMLHSFWYPAAKKAFVGVSEKDPGCAMAHWGIGMSLFRQMWQKRNPMENVPEGQAALRKAVAIGGMSERERDYVGALQAYYGDAVEVDFLSRMRRYEAAMDALHRKYPDDSEATIFYALSLLGTAYSSPPDKQLARQKRAGEILEDIFAVQPTHPGVVHYIIHSYDYPSLAEDALKAARQYAKIAPAAPHALHMPSHIFTRLGLWEESIATNLNAAAAARKDHWTREELHATDYLTYAYLQTAQDDKVKTILEALPRQKEQFETSALQDAAGFFAAAAIPARFALERRRWDEAARLTVDDDFFAKGKLCWVEATLYFARGLGAARTEDLAGARQSIAQLERCRETLSESDQALWASRVEVQRRAVAAWLALAEGSNHAALTMMRSAADLEDGTDKPPITPGAAVSARQLLAEMLLEVNRPADALIEFEAALKDAPNRFQSLYGAAQAAERAGDVNNARKYYSNLLEVARVAETDRPELREARNFVK